MSDEGFIIEGSANINRFRLLQIAAKLALEINTGLSSRVSMMNVAKNECGSPKRTKKGVLRDYTKWLESQIPGYEPNPSVKKAMEK